MQFEDINLFRMQSKLTDQLITIDSPRRNSNHLSKTMYNTISFQKYNNSHSQLYSTAPKKVWYQSASSIRRQKSPAYKFPQGERFSSVENDQRKNRLILKLNIGKQISHSKGIGFAKSKRIDHFKPKKQKNDYPSPASYYSEVLIRGKTPERAFSAGKNSSYEKKRASLMKLANQLNLYEIKGVTIPKERNPQKIFIHHGQKLPYQPQVTMNNPGVGKYNVTKLLEDEPQSTKKYYIGQTLKKFNQFVAPNPGPGAYGKDTQLVPKRVQSANNKGTFALSKRTYLVPKNPQQFSPGPDYYSIKRYLQDKK